MDLMKERADYLASIRRGDPWAGSKSDIEMQMDSTDPQPATSEMLCGFVLGCVFACGVLWLWNFKL